MRKTSAIILTAALTACVSPAWAVRHIGFETDAFNRIFPISYTKTAVFSPASFEVDCVLVAECLDTLSKAAVAETMGVITGFEGVYTPILEDLNSPTNGFSFKSARGFCVPEVRKVQPAFRQYLERTYDVEVMQVPPNHGAESWFRTTMEGEMENFTIPKSARSELRYAFYDLASLSVAWQDPFPTANTREMSFSTGIGKESIKLPFMCDVRKAETWEAKEYTLLKLPLKDESWFYAMLPKEGYDLSPVRQDITSTEIDYLLTVTKSITEKGVSVGPCAIVLPRLELFSRLDFSAALTYFRIPTRGLKSVAGDIPAREYVQYARFRLTEHAADEEPVVERDPSSVIPMTQETKKLVFNRPFFFFVYHERTATIPIAGQFFGR